MSIKSLFLALFILISGVSFGQSPRPSCEMYAAREKVFFYDQVSAGGRVGYVKRKAYLVYGDRFWVDCRLVDHDWVYVQFRNSRGVVTRGYLRSSDMEYVR
jgi:hypothetical protein